MFGNEVMVATMCALRGHDSKQSGKLSQVKVQHAGRQIWCKIDLPVEERTSLGFILGLRRLLISWGFDRRNLKVQDEVPMLSVGGSPVASASVANNALEIKWSEESWKTWGDLTGSLEYKNLVDDANKRVKQSAESRKKGGGKETFEVHLSTDYKCIKIVINR